MAPSPWPPRLEPQPKQLWSNSIQYTLFLFDFPRSEHFRNAFPAMRSLVGFISEEEFAEAIPNFLGLLTNPATIA